MESNHDPCLRPTAASLGLMSASKIDEEEAVDDNPDGELDLTGIDDDEIDRVSNSNHLPDILAIAYCHSQCHKTGQIIVYYCNHTCAM